MRFSLPRFLALTALFFAAAPAMAALKVDGKPKVGFHASGSPGALDIDGTASSISLNDDGTTLTFTVPMGGVTTGIDLRDDHMRNEFVQVAQFPNVTLSFPKSAITFPTEVGAASSGTVDGQFNAHGVNQTVKVTYKVQKSKTGWRVTAEFPFDVSQHGIAIPSYLGVTVDAHMNAAVTIDLVDSP